MEDNDLINQNNLPKNLDYEKLNPEDQGKVNELLESIDPRNSVSLINFGTKTMQTSRKLL